MLMLTRMCEYVFVCGLPQLQDGRLAGPVVCGPGSQKVPSRTYLELMSLELVERRAY